MQPLNKQPLGLLSLFDIKSGGRYPQSMGNSVQPTIDLLKWYGETNSLYLEVPTQLVPIGVPGGGTLPFQSTRPIDLADGSNLQIPQSEIWLIHDWTVKWILGDASDGVPYGGFWPGLYQSLSSITRPQSCTFGGAISGSAAAPLTGWATMQNPVFATGGTYLGAYHGGYTSASGAMAIQSILRVSRFRV